MMRIALMILAVMACAAGGLSCATPETTPVLENTATAVSLKPIITDDTSLTIRVKREKHGGGEIVSLKLETEYLPVVVASENDEAPYESLKAQAVASRTYAVFMILHHPRSEDYDILDYEEDQVYDPEALAALDRDEQERIFRAVNDTCGLMLLYKGNIICSYFVSGNKKMLPYVTFNEGKTGDAVLQSDLDWICEASPGNPYNRGCLGQIQADELARRGYDSARILRHFYGEDITIAAHQ
jgi:peptidoglycan hydrolase-like amidase